MDPTMNPMEMNPELVDSLVSGGKAWLVITLANFMPTLWALTLIFHFGRPYVLRVLRGLTLRFGADVWWLSYVLIRDALMLVTFAAGTILLLPGLFLTLTFPVFAPLASLLFFWALVVKLFWDADDDARAYRRLSLLLVAGATLYFVPLFLGVQAIEQEFMAPLAEFLVSSTNGALAGPAVTIGLVGYGLTGAYIFWRFMTPFRRRGRRPAEGTAGQSA